MASHNYGYFTASTISPFLTGKGDTLLKGGIEAALKIADERLALDGLVQFEPYFDGNAATEWGNMYEADAIRRYEELHFVEVHGKQDGISDGWMSCTPDGLVGQDGGIEVKCPFKHYNHRANLIDPDSFKADHNNQCQFNMMLTGRRWWDLVSYDPRWKEPLDIAVVRVHADTIWQEQCRSRVAQAEAIISEMVEVLKGRVELIEN